MHGAEGKADSEYARCQHISRPDGRSASVDMKLYSFRLHVLNSLASSVVSLAAHSSRSARTGQPTNKGNVHAILTISACVLPLRPAHPLVSSAGGEGGPSAPGSVSQSSLTSDHSQQ
eukprot:COSAG02_NODE_36462_length_454_cov_0.873239_1_plen_116_part_01